VISTITHCQHTVQWARQAPSSTGDANATVNPWANECNNGTSYQVGWLTGTSEFGDLVASSFDDTIEQCFVVKYAANGTEEWVTVVNSTGISRCYAVAIQQTDDSILIGGLFSGNVVGWNGEGTQVEGTSEDLYIGFVTKIFNDGTRGYFRVIGNLDGSSTSVVKGLGTDDLGNVYVAGNYNGTITLGLNEFTSEAEGDLFYGSFSDENGDFLYGNATGGYGQEIVTDSQTNQEGFTCIIGLFEGADFGSLEPSTDESVVSMFITGIEPNGTVRFFETFTGTLGLYLSAVYTDELGHCSFVGSFNQTLDQYTTPGFAGFFGRVNNAGTLVLFNVTDGEVEDAFNDVSCDDSNGDCFIVGTYVTNMTFGDQTVVTDDSDADAFILRVNRDGLLQEILQIKGEQTFGSNVCNSGQEAYSGGSFAQSVELGSFSLTSPSNYSLYYFNWGRGDTTA